MHMYIHTYASVFSRGFLRTSFLMASRRGQMKKGGSLPGSRVAVHFSQFQKGS